MAALLVNKKPYIMSPLTAVYGIASSLLFRSMVTWLWGLSKARLMAWGSMTLLWMAQRECSVFCTLATLMNIAPLIAWGSGSKSHGLTEDDLSESEALKLLFWSDLGSSLVPSLLSWSETSSSHFETNLHFHHQCHLQSKRTYSRVKLVSVWGVYEVMREI